jgi:hypothetical protein
MTGKCPKLTFIREHGADSVQFGPERSTGDVSGDVARSVSGTSQGHPGDAVRNRETGGNTLVARPVVELKQLSPDFVRDPYPVYARLRAEGPVHHVRDPDGEELWLIVGYEACRTAFTDPRLSRDWTGSGDIRQIRSPTC